MCERSSRCNKDPHAGQGGWGLGRGRTAGQGRKLKAERGCKNVIPVACICPHPNTRGSWSNITLALASTVAPPSLPPAAPLGWCVSLGQRRTPLGRAPSHAPGLCHTRLVPVILMVICRFFHQVSQKNYFLSLSLGFWRNWATALKKHDDVGPKGKHCLISGCWHFSSFCK